MVGAILDYEKFFDRFHPSWVRGLMARAGIPQGMANQLHGMYNNLRRYICVAGTFGAVIEQSNCIGKVAP